VGLATGHPNYDQPVSLPCYQRVALKRDLPEHDLRKGDVAMLVGHVPHPEGGEQGCVLEVFNALGESIAVVAVRQSDVEASAPTKCWPYVLATAV
jgi:hypothetical protein